MSLILTSGTVLAHAQPAPTEEMVAATPTASQVGLYAQANRAYLQGRYEDAIVDLRRALAEGGLNVLYYSLGLSLQRLERCAEADDAFARALEARSVVTPPASEVRQRVGERRALLRRTCPRSVTFRCRPATAEVTIDGGDAMPCPGRPMRLPAGRHVVRASAMGRSETRTLELDRDWEQTVDLRVRTAVGSSASGWTLSSWGWLVGLSGVGLAGVAAAADIWWLPDRIEAFRRAVARGDPGARGRQAEAQNWQTGVLVTYAFAGGLVAGGSALVLFGSGRGEKAPRVTASIGLGSVGFVGSF